MAATASEHRLDSSAGRAPGAGQPTHRRRTATMGVGCLSCTCDASHAKEGAACVGKQTVGAVGSLCRGFKDFVARGACVPRLRASLLFGSCRCRRAGPRAGADGGSAGADAPQQATLDRAALTGAHAPRRRHPQATWWTWLSPLSWAPPSPRWSTPSSLISLLPRLESPSTPTRSSATSRSRSTAPSSAVSLGLGCVQRPCEAPGHHP